MPVAILTWRPLVRNTLRGFATIRLGSALKINDVAIHRHANGKCWASFPSKPVLLPDGTAKIGDNGKTMYVPILEWDSKASADRFSESVIGAVELGHPGATG
jgi:hypothetical protein